LNERGKKNLSGNSSKETKRNEKELKNNKRVIVSDKRKQRDLSVKEIFRSRSKRGGKKSNRES